MLAEAEARRAQKKNADHQRALGRDKLAVEREREDKLKKDRLEAQEHLVDVTKRRLKAASEIYQKVGKALQDNAQERHQLDLGYYQAEAETIKAQVELKELQVGQDLIEEASRRRGPVARRQGARLGRCSTGRSTWRGRLATRRRSSPPPRAGSSRPDGHAGEASAGAIVPLGDVSSMVADRRGLPGGPPRGQGGRPGRGRPSSGGRSRAR